VFTAVGLLIVLMAAVAVPVIAVRLPAVSRAVRRLGGAAGAGLEAGARVASRVARALLTGRGGETEAWRLALFAVVAILPLAVAFAMPRIPALSAFVDPGWFLAIGLAFLLLVLLAAAFIVREDYDVMDGILAESDRRFRNADAVPQPAVVAIAAALVVAYIAAAAWWLMAVHGVPLVARLPVAGPAPLAYLLVALRALPTSPLLSLIDRITGDDTQVVLGPAFVAGAYFAAARVIGVAIVLGIVVIAIEHTRQVRRFLAEIEASDAYRPELIARGRRAPRAIVRGILNAATAPGGRADRQQRLIGAAIEIGLREFPALLCTRLPGLSPEIQSLGLDRSIEMFRYRTREFDTDESLALFAAAASAFAAGNLELEPTKKLTRLMASVAIFKKETLKIPPGLKTSVMDALKVELAKPRAKEDAALRGILRDLQSALGGEPIILKPILPFERGQEEWLKPVTLPPADPAVQPESPSTTVH
jgi:hypothetical protein